MADKKLRTAKYSTGFEGEIYKKWYEKDLFYSKPNVGDPFVIVIPPPNITGRLHMGHALNNILQDVLIRYNLLCGRNVMWVPGTDHGGIATQTVVEKNLLSGGIKKCDLGRDEFLKRMEEWRMNYGGTILEQLKELGCACDWKNTHFTMDEVCSRAVKEAFVRLYEEGKIYRGYRMINFCVRCETSLSDVEVEYREERGFLWYIKYPIEGGGGFVTVATTRPETMLGDTAVAVNPSDGRFSHLKGKELILPIVGRRIPVVFDEIVQPEFGTGAVKVTPAHDFNDFEIGQRHGLKSVKVIDEKGRMTAEAGDEFRGLTRDEARRKILEKLSEKRLLVKREELTHSVSTCYRCGEPIEPMLSLQWFLKMEELAKSAIKATQAGAIKFYPERWRESFLNFLNNIRDWCLSRQIWWGHRLPVYYCKKCAQNSDSAGGIIVSREHPEKCPVCQSAEIEQDKDVLDTWFSSALWPFEVFGWPENTKELKYFYPTSVLVTGHEILHLWVARMVMMGLKFAGDIPFHSVYIHGIVRDKHGKKMSKSLGNTVDPLEVTGKYGVDSLRFSIVRSAVAGHDLLISEDDFISSRNFMNKIWNAANVVINRADAGDIDIKDADDLSDKWILTEFSDLLKEIRTCFEMYDAAKYSRLVYDFFWNKFCGWHLEILKLKENSFSKRLSYYLYKALLLALHPVIPFLTEEIYGCVRSADDPESILLCRWPDIQYESRPACDEMTEVFALIQGIRNIRSTFHVPSKTKVSSYVSTDEKTKESVEKTEFFIKPLASVDKIIFTEERPPQSSNFATPRLRCSVPLGGVIDIKAEVQKLAKEAEQIDSHIAKLEKLLSNGNFVGNAGEEVIQQKKALLADFSQKKKNILFFLESLPRRQK